MSISDKIKWSSRSTASWLLLAITIFVLVYLFYVFFQSRSKTGEACVKNHECKSSICYHEDARHLSYCTNKCGGDEDCPEGWKCLRPPGFPQGMYVCIRR